MKEKLGGAIQLAGLVALPLAVVYGLQGGDIFSELLIATAGVAILLIGRSMR